MPSIARGSRPYRAATSAVCERPVRAGQRATSPRSASGTGSRNASGRPLGGIAPRPSRYRPASSAAMIRSSPARRIAHARRSATSSRTTSPAVARVREPGAISDGERSPMRRSRSCRPSAPRARARSDSPCRSASRPASASASMQIAQLLLAEQLAQEVAVEGERLGAPLGGRGVVLVHVEATYSNSSEPAKGEACASPPPPGQSRASAPRPAPPQGRQVEPSSRHSR